MSDFKNTQEGTMKWTLDSVSKETNHPFLNFYTLHYTVDQADGQKNYQYYVASRKEVDTMRPRTKDFKKPDAVIIGLYKIEDGEVSILMTKQFRPALGTYVFSIVAGLIDEGEDVFQAAIREAHEEAGAKEITDLEILTPISPTSTGMSDEEDAFLMARVVSLENNDLEEFEDISSSFVTLKECQEMFQDPKYTFALNARLWIHYMIARFGVK